MYDDETRILRLRESDRDDAIDARSGDPVASSPGSLVARTTTVSSYPTAAARYFAVKADWLGGSEVEGGTATFDADSVVFYAYNIGSAIPASGTRVVVDRVGGRWVFSYNG